MVGCKANRLKLQDAQAYRIQESYQEFHRYAQASVSPWSWQKVYMSYTQAWWISLDHQQNMLMLQRLERAGSTQEGWEKNSTFRSSLNTPGACQEWLGIVWRVCASSCPELRVPGRVRSNWPLQEQSQGS